MFQNDLVVFRQQFKEVLDMYGIDALYYQVKPDHKYTVAGEISANYYDPVPCKILFDQVPTVPTLKRLGWVTELAQGASLIHVEFDTPGIAFDAIYQIKDPLTPNDGKFFRVTKLRTGILFPVAITCQIVPILGTDPEQTVKPYDGNRSVFLNTEKVEQIEEI